MSIHAEWLSLIEVSGAFLAEPVLHQAFPQGLEGIETTKKQAFRQTYEEWREAFDSDDELQPKLHREWVNWVLKIGLEWDEDDEGNELKSGSNVPTELKLELLEHDLILKPDYALYADETKKPYLLVSSYPANVELTEVVAGDGWSTTPAERMSQLCRATGTRLGLVTNGEQWMMVDAPEGGITSYASWYARLWSQEPITLKAFFSLLNISTVFNGFGLEARKLTDLLDDSLKHQDEVTETLGAQVQRAVEVLIQSLDRVNNDSNDDLLEGVEPAELYEAGLTYMMRLVFLLCAEERGLLLLGDETYEANYAVSTLRMKLREEAGLHGEEVLSYRNNAWARLLAVFRAVYGGVEHESMRMPALGGSLFDPDRFPFLEGRSKESNWKTDEARPLPIDNRTVLLFLDAIQLFQGRTLSYRALDVEQIGYVYEGLLERTVVRSSDFTMVLDSTRSAKKPWLMLGELESAKLDGSATVKKLLKERSGSSVSRITNDLAKEVTEAESEKLLLACENDANLRDRIKPVYHFLRTDAWGNPLVYPENAFMVATGTDRRETGTHYTPKSLTESVVQDTLDPLVYIGPSEGKDRAEWILISPEELLTLKVCDPAMGSGAFLVQVCRYLSERLVEAWVMAESKRNMITIDGSAVDSLVDQELLTDDPGERLIAARRLVSERCIYGVDVNPLAVELAKLSIWLVTLAKGRPFCFLDHNLRDGDSLLGLTNLDQLRYFSMSAGEGSERNLFAQKIDDAIRMAVELRLNLRAKRILDIRDVEVMQHLEQQAREQLEDSLLIANVITGETLAFGRGSVDATILSLKIGRLLDGKKGLFDSLKRSAKENLNAEIPKGMRRRKAFHWCLEFPEVFTIKFSGFNAIVGNPPFKRGKDISGLLGANYREYLVNIVAKKRGSADLCAYFLCRSLDLIDNNSLVGLVVTNTISEGDTKEVSLDGLLDKNSKIINAQKSIQWPGKAAVVVSLVTLIRGKWNGALMLNGESVDLISSSLSDVSSLELEKLDRNKGLVFQGSVLLGNGFLLEKDEAILRLNLDERNREIIFPYLTGSEFCSGDSSDIQKYVINFWDWSLETASKYPDIIKMIEERVKPGRNAQKRKSYRENWWRFAEPTLGLYRAIGRGKKLEGKKGDQDFIHRVIVRAKDSKHHFFELVNNDICFDQTVNVFSTDSLELFGVLSSDIHSAFFYDVGSTLGAAAYPRYIQSDVFMKFPLPASSTRCSSLAKCVEEYLTSYSKIKTKYSLSNTELLNAYHSENTSLIEIIDLRELMKKVTNFVALRYGWDDIELNCDFFEVDELPDSDRVRFTLSRDCRREVLRRLYSLNQKYSLEETAVTKPKSKSKDKKNINGSQLDIFRS